MKPDNSHIKLGKRVKKSKSAEHGWLEVDIIPPDEPCILALPGSNADNSKKANGFAKMIQEILKDKKFPIYSVEYDLAERNFRVDREAVLARYEQENPKLPFIRLVKDEDKTYVPQYIKELYKMTIAPRLRDRNGNRVSIEQAAQRLSMMVFATHCQGSTVLLQLEHLMRRDMREMGYNNHFRNYLLQQIHSVNVAPVTPYGATKTSAIKFASLSDDRVTSVHTDKIEYILHRKREHERFMASLETGNTNVRNYNSPFTMNLSLSRPTENETVFAVNNMYPVEIQKEENMEDIEHAFDSYSDKDDDNRTKQGDQLSLLFHTSLNWLVDNAKKNQKQFTELPHILKEPLFKKFVERAMNNRYEVITKEIKLLKKRNSNQLPFKTEAETAR